MMRRFDPEQVSAGVDAARVLTDPFPVSALLGLIASLAIVTAVTRWAVNH